jgi:hypothetical protein
MIPPIRYFDLTDIPAGTPGLGRVIERDGGLYAEVLHEGRWIQFDAVFACMFNPSFGHVITAEEAQHLAEQLGGSLD